MLYNNETLKKGKFCIAVGSPYQLETYYNTAIVGNVSNINCIVIFLLSSVVSAL